MQPEVIYVPGKGWHYWNEDRWSPDETGVLTRLFIQAIRSIPDDDTKETTRHKKQSESLRSITAGLRIAQDLPGITVPGTLLDSNPYLLNTPTGYVDLRTSTFHHPSANLLLTQSTTTKYDPTAQAPLFSRFLQEVLPDPEIRAFLQRALGYTLTGLVKEEVIFLLVGKGANGKTTLTSLIRRIRGTYASPIATSLLTARHTGNHETEKLALQGTRFAIANETDFGQQVAEAKIKALVSTDAITARGAYERTPVTFQPTHKLWLSTNYLPNIDGSDDGLARRLIVIPFEQVFNAEDRDTNLHEHLQTESAGILNWLIEGAALYLQNGLNPPARIQEEVADYQTSMDTFARFIEEYIIPDPNYSATNPELWEVFSRWQSSEPHNLRLGRRSFGQAMKRRYKQSNQNGVRQWPGLRVRTPGQPADNETAEQAAQRAAGV